MKSLRNTRHTKKSNAPIIEILADDFEIPQLNKTRRIWALLPHDYIASDKKYPVLYLQDAQNLFDDHAPFGSWEIDKRLAHLAAQGKGDVIIIAIDHAGRGRIKEYSPYHHRRFGKGEGKLYSKFIIETLMPHVNKTYRTLSDREHTGIGGSSMGALISAYTAIKNPEHFGRMMILSPSFWYSDEIYFDAFNHTYILPTKIYLYAGERESKYMTQHVHRFQRAMNTHLFESALTHFKISINPNGEHQESYWGEAFEDALDWLFFNTEEHED